MRMGGDLLLELRDRDRGRADELEAVDLHRRRGGVDEARAGDEPGARRLREARLRLRQAADDGRRGRHQLGRRSERQAAEGGTDQ